MKANTPLEQIYFNTKDIKELKQIIAPFYNCSIDLGNNATNVAVSNTNMPKDTTKAYITDYNGNVYKFIAFNDDKTTAYIEYYASLKGADGRDAVNDIDDTTTANNKLWSSQKTNNEIINKSDKGVYYTTQAPTETSGALSYNINQLNNINTNISIKINDLIIYIDNDKTKELYRVISVIDLTSTIIVLKIGDFGGGKQLYQHNVRIKFGSNYYELFLQITNNNPNTMFTDKASIIQYLIDNGHTTESGNSDMNTNLLRASGRVQYEGSSTIEIKMVEGIYHRNSLNGSIFAVGYNDSTSWQDIQVTTGTNNMTIKEFVKEL